MLHHARGCATGLVAPAIAVPPVPTFAPCPASARAARRLRRQLRSRLRRLPQPQLARCARLHKGRYGVNAPLRCAFNITASYAKSGQSLRRLRLVSRPLRALRVRVSAVMSCAPARTTASFGASRWFIQRCATGGLRPTVGLRLRACRRARYGRRRRQSVGETPSRQHRLIDFSRCQIPVRRSRSASSIRPVKPEHTHRVCPANARRCASASPSVCRRRR